VKYDMGVKAEIVSFRRVRYYGHRNVVGGVDRRCAFRAGDVNMQRAGLLPGLELQTGKLVGRKGARQRDNGEIDRGVLVAAGGEGGAGEIVKL
jgi:hypothetical protein